MKCDAKNKGCTTKPTPRSESTRLRRSALNGGWKERHFHKQNTIIKFPTIEATKNGMEAKQLTEYAVRKALTLLKVCVMWGKQRSSGFIVWPWLNTQILRCCYSILPTQDTYEHLRDFRDYTFQIGSIIHYVSSSNCLIFFF